MVVEGREEVKKVKWKDLTNSYLEKEKDSYFNEFKVRDGRFEKGQTRIKNNFNKSKD